MVGAVGASCPKTEIFGRELEYTRVDNHSVELTVKAHQAYFMECEMM